MAEVIAGRDGELAFLREFVERVPAGAAALVLEGEAGMGKTTLWREALQQAAMNGLRTLEAQPAESESELSFAGLGDLLDPVLDEALEPLPAGQRSALSRALVLEDVEGASPDAHAVGVALLGAVRALALCGPVLVAVDDVQWLDSASAGALAYAGRRLRDEPIGLLLARRTGLPSGIVDELRRSLGERATALDVGPLDAAALHRLISDRLGATLPRPLLAEVQQASGGNPFYAIEIVRTLQRRGAGVEAGRPLPVPDSLHDLVDERLTALPDESRHFLLAAAAYAHPTVVITEAGSGVLADAGLDPALDAGIVELDGSRIRFTHPLLAAGVLELADPRRRIEVHRRLADLLEDPEARAWQFAACHVEPDETVAAVLEAASAHARGRGAPRPAALLLDRAAELTPTDLSDERIRREVDAAYLHFEAGDSRRAEAQLRRVILQLAPGGERAHAVARLARVRSYESQSEAAALFMQAVDEAAASDMGTLAIAHEGVANCFLRLHERLAEAIHYAARACELGLELGDSALVGEALTTQLLAETLLGSATAGDMVDRALAVQTPATESRVLRQPLPNVAARWRWTDDVEQAHEVLQDAFERATELGDESSVPLLLMFLGEVECSLGRLESARTRSLEGQELSEQSGQRTLFANHLGLECLASAHLGRAEDARLAADRVSSLLAETGARHAELLATQGMTHLSLACREPDRAVGHSAQFLAFVEREAIAEPGFLVFIVDRVEALIELDRSDEALQLLDWYEGNARRLERASALANCARCRGLLAAQAGDLDSAMAAFEEALELHVKVDLPLDRGRTLLALGVAQRRMKRRREARTTLEAALEVFDRIGAALWAERARGELKRISGRAATPGALTPAEERIAALVAQGKTNKEVAAALFLSDRTVEGHLAHVFGKLGIRHRTELAGAFQTQGIALSHTGDTPVSAEQLAP